MYWVGSEVTQSFHPRMLASESGRLTSAALGHARQ